MATLDPTAVGARAHQIWISKGRRPGHALEDWLQAERELGALRASPPAPAAPLAAAKPPAPAPAKPAPFAAAPPPAAFKPPAPAAKPPAPGAPPPPKGSSKKRR